MLKKLLGIAPQPTEDGAYSPSKLALKLATSPKTDLSDVTYAKRYQGDKPKILVVCTEERNLTMANGKKFSTGNHPVEALVPMIHLRNAGFEFDIITPTGKPAQFELWAMPQEDAEVKQIYADLKDQINSPLSLAAFAKNLPKDGADYSAVFIPGGHGAMIDLPDNDDLGKLIHWAHEQDLYMITICHGPAALIAANGAGENRFPYAGYELTVFPDAVDKQTPMVGYMPGHLPWKVGEKLTELGVTIVNKKADKSCHIDRKLITGASPAAANELGKLATKTLLGL